jgi:hypothetical protein
MSAATVSAPPMDPILISVGHSVDNTLQTCDPPVKTEQTASCCGGRAGAIESRHKGGPMSKGTAMKKEKKKPKKKG